MSRTPDQLLKIARKCEGIARGCSDEQAKDVLLQTGKRLERKAEAERQDMLSSSGLSFDI